MKSTQDASYMMLEIWGRHSTEPVDHGIRHMWDSEYYTFQVESEEASLRSTRHTMNLVQELANGEDSSWRNEKPEMIEGEFVPWFSIIISVSDTHKKISKYAIDYRKWDSCPLNVIDAGMGIYRQIKRNIKAAVKARRARA